MCTHKPYADTIIENAIHAGTVYIVYMYTHMYKHTTTLHCTYLLWRLVNIQVLCKYVVLLFSAKPCDFHVRLRHLIRPCNTAQNCIAGKKTDRYTTSATQSHVMCTYLFLLPSGKFCASDQLSCFTHVPRLPDSL